MQGTRYVVGLLTLALALAGAWFLWQLLDRAADRPGLGLQIEFRDARGLRPGGDVRYRGVTVGSVRGVQVSADGTKAVVDVLLEPAGAVQACVNSTFWIVAPRFSGLGTGITGLDTLVRDAYVAFVTPEPAGSSLLPGSLLGGVERPPASLEPDSLEPPQHGDLLMALLVPENHGLRPGSPVVFRGQVTGDVRSVTLAEDGSYVEVQLRIAHRHRRTVTDRSEFWVARPYVSGALLSGFTVSDVQALLSPFVSYYTEPARGVPVEDGYRIAATSARPEHDDADVPASAMAQPTPAVTGPQEPLALVRIVYAAVERDTMSADDPVAHEGTGVLYLDGSGRAAVLTARSVVDGNYTEWDSFGAAPDIAQEQIKVIVPKGPVLRAHRVWVAPDGRDLAVLVLEAAPPDLPLTSATMFDFAAATEATAGLGGSLRAVRADGAPLPPAVAAATDPPRLLEHRGGVLLRADRIAAILGQRAERANDEPALVRLDAIPDDLRPRP